MAQLVERTIIGNSVPIKNLIRLIEKVASSKTSVLVVGESGTGKELVARSMHDMGDMKGKPFIAINCGAIPENLLESELFGHKKGSFTGAISDKPGLFESAHGGTLFLDEIGELPLNMQVKLLRAIQEKTIRRVGGNEDIKIDVRIIAATNRNLESQVKLGQFREDLFYRLNVIQIRTPPLRERGTDIQLLADIFAKRFADRQGKKVLGFSPHASDVIQAYSWPGNVRELENVVERAVTLESGNVIAVESLPLELQKFAGSRPAFNEVLGSTPSVVGGAPGSVSAQGALEPFPQLPRLGANTQAVNLDDVIAEVERYYIMAALEQTKGKKKAASAILGITFRSFRYRLQKLGISDDSNGSDDA